MSRSLIYLVAGARPNFMKIAPIVRALQARADRFEFKIIHTGQHYDREMSDVFFDELGIPKPDYHLDAGGGSHATQTAKIMVAFEEICQKARPDCVLVVGDVNSTLACSIDAKKLDIPVAHVEAGLRSGDMRMPEEINRLVTDSISDWFFCTEPAGVDNLLREGKNPAAVFHVGHVMVDNLLYQRDQLDGSDKTGLETEALKQQFPRYGVVTLHRPSNVDDEQNLHAIAGALRDIAGELPLIIWRWIGFQRNSWIEASTCFVSAIRQGSTTRCSVLPMSVVLKAILIIRNSGRYARLSANCARTARREARTSTRRWTG